MRLVLALALLAAPLSVHAQALTCEAISVTCASGACTAVSIASGGFTTDAFNATGYSTLKVVGNLTDASDGVSNLKHALTENFIATGTFEAYPFCENDAPVMTCGQLAIHWDPRNAAGGKNYTLWLPWRGRYGKLALTPTGHGTGDVLRLELYGCK